MNTATAAPLKVMIVDTDPVRRAQLAQSLRATGCSVIERDAMTVDLVGNLQQLRPDIIVIDIDAPDRDMLEHVCVISRDDPRPIVLFTDDDDPAKIKQAIRAGVTSYVVKSIEPARIKHQALRSDLAEAQKQLAERKLVERAKGIVMKQKSVSEHEAYHLLRKLAMERNAKLVDIAAQVVDLAQAFA
jgi:response regulator NasT